MEETRRFGDELQHRRYTLRVLLESAAQAIVAVNADGKIVLSNKMAYQMFGYEPGELVGEPLEMLLPEEIRDRHSERHKGFFNSPASRPMGTGLVLEGRRKDGARFPIEVFLNHIDTSGGTLGVAFVSDISERKRAEEALRRREEQYRNLFDNMNEAVVYCEMVFENGVGTDFIYRMVNPRFETMTGRKDVVGKRISELVPGIRELDPEWFQIHARVASTGVPEKFEIFLNSLKQWYSMSVYSPEKGYFVAIFDNITERKKTEEALQQSEERLRLAVEGTGAGAFDFDLRTGKHVWSDVTRSHFGLPPGAEVEDAAFRQAIHPDDRAQWQRAMEEAIRPEGGGMYATEYRAIGIADGEERWLSVRGKVLFDSEGRPERLVALTRDITEQKRAEAALRDSEERLRLTIDATGVGTFDFDPRTRKRIWSDVAKSYFGLPPEAEVDDETFLRGLHPDDRERVRRVVEEIAAGEPGGSYAMEYRTIGIADGKARWVSVRGKVLFDSEGRSERYLGVMQDITERKRAEDALRQSEERLRLAVDCAGLGTMELDPYTGKRIWSVMAKRCFGLPPDAEIDDTTFRKGVHPDDWERVRQSVEQSMRPESSGEYEEEFRTVGIQDGRERWILARGRVFFDSQGRIARRLAVMQDMTERRRAEEALRESEERLRLAVESAGLGTFEIDVHTGKRTYSDVKKSFFGLPPEAEVDETTFGKHVHPDDRERMVQLVAEALGSQGSGRYTAEYRTAATPDGKERWLRTWARVLFDRDGKPERFIGVTQDLTERKRMEEALHRREREISSVLDDNPDQIVRLDREYRYMYVNAKFASMMGILREECIGKTAVEVGIAQELVERWRPMTLRTFETGQPGSLEISHQTPAGPVELEERFIPEFGPDGEVESILLIGRDITERKRLERVVERSRDEVRALAASLLTAQEEERRRVARELHDQICQDLAALAIELGGLAAEPPEPSAAARRFRALQARVVKAAEETRHISHQLHPSVLDDLGLIASLRSLCREFSAQTGIAVEFSDKAGPGTVPREVASCLYRVAQQSLQNTAKHARATRVSVGVTWREGRLALAVADDGVGFDQDAVQGQGGLGLIGMKERARLVKGTLTIATRLGQGTRVEMEVPLPQGS